MFSNANEMKLFLMIFPRISLHCMPVPVQNREYETGLFCEDNAGRSKKMRYFQKKAGGPPLDPPLEDVTWVREMFLLSVLTGVCIKRVYVGENVSLIICCTY